MPNSWLTREGVLVWAVQGAIRWFREGLERPEEVREAVRSYRNEMDQIGRFIAERCSTGANLHVRARELYSTHTKPGPTSPKSHTISAKCTSAGRSASVKESNAKRQAAVPYTKGSISTTEAVGKVGEMGNLAGKFFMYARNRKFPTK